MAQKVFQQRYDLTQRFDAQGDSANLPDKSVVENHLQTYVDSNGKSMPQKFIEQVLAHVATLSGVTVQLVGLSQLRFDAPADDQDKVVVSYYRLEVQYGPNPLKMPTDDQADEVLKALTTGNEHISEEWNRVSLEEYGAASAVTLQNAGGEEFSRSHVDDGT